MKLTALAYFLLPALALGQGLNDLCHNGNAWGTCQTTTWCAAHSGGYESGFCPGGADNVKCCFVPECYTLGAYCNYVDNPNVVCNNNGGFWLAGYCPGPSTYECCVPV